MLATLIALIGAHVLADFVLQTRAMVTYKRRPAVFARHIAIVGLTALCLIAPASIAGWTVVVAVALAHAAIDASKLFAVPANWLAGHAHRPLAVFLADQAAHGLSLVLIAGLAASAFDEGLWPALLSPDQTVWLLSALAASAGFVVATRAGGFVMALFMARFNTAEQPPAPGSDDGVPEGGAWIGWLERALIFLLILAQQFEAIGFLIAAKSVLRFQYAAIRHQSEIVIIGTLASFGWAIAAGQLTRIAIELLGVAG